MTILETFPNPAPQRDYLIHIQVPEFTCLCPKTGQPDFAYLHIWYIADAWCLELKSLKLYIASFRNQGCFHEAVSNQMLDDWVGKIQPRFMRLLAKFNVRGGITTHVTAEYQQTNWQASSSLLSLKDDVCSFANINSVAQ